MTTTEERKDALKWIDASLEHGRRCYKNSQMYCNFEPDVEKARKTVAILETIRAALASEPMGWQPMVQHESGWLVESSGKRPAWFEVLRDDETGNYYLSSTFDSTKAIRFARKCDAEAFIKLQDLVKCTATEHIWSDLPPPPKGAAS